MGPIADERWVIQSTGFEFLVPDLILTGAVLGVNRQTEL
jgi:hypothetical protein